MKLSKFVIFLLLILPILIFFFTRGVITHDEGYILQSSEKIYSGQLPYRDFNFVYTPLSIFLTALSFKLLAPSILTSRILMLTISLISIILINKIIFLSTKNKLYSTFAVLIFVSWGPTHINFSWPVMFAMLFAFLSIYLFLKFLENRNTKYLFCAGIAVFTVFLSKQNFGLAMLIPVISLYMVKNMRNIKYLLSFGYGYIWGIIIFCIYLLKTDSFAPFVNDMYEYTFRRILIDDRLTTAFIFSDSLTKMLGRTLLYLLPFIFPFFAIILLTYRRRFHLLFIPVFIIVFYIFGIRPTTDYVHLTPLLSLIGLPIALLLRYNISTTVRVFLIFFSLLFVTLGFQTALFKGYYRWDSPIIQHNKFFSNPKVNIFLNDKFYNEFQQIIDLTYKYTKKDDYIFVNSYNSLLYFITDRTEPIKSSFLKIEINNNGYYEDVKSALVGKQIKFIILDQKSLNNLPIKNYILDKYHFLKNIQEFDIYIRKT